jgi:hypothetical protein
LPAIGYPLKAAELVADWPLLVMNQDAGTASLDDEV